ncbi:transcription termination/antitermination protein NusG [Ureaplasma ceti]|uniref:Transcription termination/antitermination protein NusG n=1 Tax=Ureaplasma ceti TaxID=3119530 RepID=A0ABP9U7B1_9BACT
MSKLEISPITGPQWYIITAVSGNEDSVVNNLKGKIASYGYSDRVEDIKIIKEKVVTIEEFNVDNAPASLGRKQKNVIWKTIEKNGKTVYQKIKTEEKNKFNGYIFIKMLMDDEIWFIIRNTQMVTGIIGSSGKNTKPIPVSSEEIERILNANSENAAEIIEAEKERGKNVMNVYQEADAVILETSLYEAPFGVGAQVKVIGQHMTGDVGYVRSLNDNKGIATVELEMFGRNSLVDFDYSDLEEIEE